MNTLFLYKRKQRQTARYQSTTSSLERHIILIKRDIEQYAFDGCRHYYIIGTGVGLGLAVAAPLYILPAIGFGAGGVAAGSAAAAVQSTIGNVAAGSLFATLQSAGATGTLSWIASGAMTAAGTAAGAVVGAIAG